jgi:membrane associated rhomboid family serine protease
MIPLGDSPNPPGVPVVNYALLAINIAIYVFITVPLSASAVNPNDPVVLEYLRTVFGQLHGPVSVHDVLRQTSAYDLFVFQHGFRPAAPALGDLFFSMFLHAGFAHLAGNMLFLWIYGDNVEHRLGSFRYLLAYLGTGTAATLFHTAFAAHSPLPLVGASGAISGILGFYFLWFPRNQVRILLLFFPFLMDVVTVPARLLLGIYILLDNILPFALTGGAAAGVAYGAHIGGFLAGVACAWVMDRREVTKTPPDYVAHLKTPPTPTHTIRQAIEEGRFEQAAEAYFALGPEDSRGSLNPHESLLLASWLQEHGHDQAALVVYRRHLRDYPQGPGAAEAHLGAAMIQAEKLQQPTAAYQHLLDALDLDPAPETAARARALLDVIAEQHKLRRHHMREGG